MTLIGCKTIELWTKFIFSLCISWNTPHNETPKACWQTHILIRIGSRYARLVRLFSSTWKCRGDILVSVFNTPIQFSSHRLLVPFQEVHLLKVCCLLTHFQKILYGIHELPIIIRICYVRISVLPSGSCLQDKASSRSRAVAGSIVKIHSFLKIINSPLWHHQLNNVNSSNTHSDVI